MSEPKGKKILIVDDEPGVCKILSKSLAAAEYSIFTANDGSLGLKTAEEIKPDLVLLDLKLPGEMDGIGVLRRLKEHSPNTPVVVITAYPSAETDFEQMKYGVYGEISKPFNLDNVVKIVGEALKTSG